ncbi:MAG: ROK family protein [Armatimonadetes bacterium]|nr:ROK family protein [Armatimonadota bacterium]
MEPLPAAFHVLGVDLGGTKTALVAGVSDGSILARLEFPTEPERGYPEWLARFSVEFESLKNQTPDWQPHTAGISVGGPADWQAGRLQSPPNLPGWQCDIRADVARRSGVNCRMEHDGRAGAMAEQRFGAGRGVSNLIFLTLGTGIGAGVIANGQILRGAGGTAGESGHLRIARDGPEAYGKRGSLEAFASGAGISRLAAYLHPEQWPFPPDARAVISAAAQGDSAAEEVLRTSADKLGAAMAILVDLLNPEMISLGSLAGRLPGWYLEQASSIVEKEALPQSAAQCRILPSQLGDRLQDTAAIMAALEGL